MDIFREIKPLKAFLREKNNAGFSIGFVPTMGALHAGHLSLVQSAKALNCITVCSVFINPAQFNNPEDLLKYPRTAEADIALLEKASCDVLFIPEVHVLYPTKAATFFDFGRLDKVMEGEFRPGHFSGVGLVVSKLFHIVEPQHAFFGQKDWQQFTIIKQLVQDLNFNVQLHSVPTLRESDGLAMSSRNQRLTNDQRKKAIIFYQTLLAAEKLLSNKTPVSEVYAVCKQGMEQIEDVRLEYIQLVDRENLMSLDTVEERGKAVLCIAGFVGDIRLIDNILL